MRTNIMIRQYLLSIFVVFAVTPLSVNALPEANIITLGDATSVEQAVSDVSATLESQGLEIVLTLDHSANAASVGLELAPTTVIFARLPASAERRKLRASETIAIDLPIKFLIFEQDNEIRLATNSVGYLIERHDLKTQDRLLNIIDRIQDQFGTPTDGLVTVQSTQSIPDTVSSLQDALVATGTFGIPLVLDFDDTQRSRKYYRHRTPAPTLIVFGNPNVGTPLMQVQQSIGIDLPQKFLVWEDNSGVVNITYNDPFVLADRHSIEGQDARLTAVSNALNNFAQIGAGL